MGCCVSSANPKAAARNAAAKSAAAASAARENRSPPMLPFSNPVPEEEESVKEVLSETPSVPKRPSAFSNGDQKWIRPVLPAIAKDIQNGKKQQQQRDKPVAVAGFISSEDFPEEDASAHSGSVSTNYTDKSEFDGQRSFRQKSFSGREANSRAAVGRSPARRNDQSPSRGRVGPGSGPRGNAARRDPAESSGRRSMSPAKASSGLVRSGSTRKAGKSPSRVKPERNEKILKLEEYPGVGRRNRPPTESGDESLENPLVSLECFIFL